MSKDTEVQQLIINKLTKEQYNSIEEKSLTEIYDITDDAHFTESEISSLLETKQNKLIAGNNISFSGDTISATDTKYTAGNGINISEDNVISSTQNSAEWGNITGTLTEQTDLQEVLDTKVNKEVGKSLISDTEIKRLATLENYNDTEVKSNISELQSSVTGLQETKQNKLTAGSGIQISDNTISATISSINWGNIEGDINSQTDLKSKLDTKVDKQEGKSLISDTEIERLASVKNYDDTEIKSNISELQSSKQDKLTAGENISISGNTISNKIKPDTKTIVQNEDGTLTSIGNKTKSDTIKIDWIGTKEEYDSGISDGSIQSDWFCYITDDEQTVDYSLYANEDLSNLSKTGNDYINQSKALTTGNVSSNPDVYADVLKRAHSTFDKSKFKVVGSPTITDDGVVSGFSDSNYISKNIVCDYNTSFLFRLPDFITGNDVTSEQYIYTLEKFTFLTVMKKGQITFSASASKDNSTRVFLSGNVGAISPNTRYSVFISWLNNTYNIYIKGGIYNDWELLYSKTSSEKILLSGNFHYGYRADYPTLYWKSNLDLKLSYLIADGIPVFNGNKTGLYVAKPDNYEKVGDVVVSDDGVASGFSASNFVKTAEISELNKVSKSIRFTSSFIYNTIIAEQTIWNKNLNFDFRLVNGDISLRTYSGSTVNAFTISKAQHKVADNEKTFCDVIITPNLLSVEINGIKFTKEVVTDLSYLSSSGKDFRIGMSNALGLYSRTSIDLNAFKIYVDGNLVYQPCLKIPYTETFEHPNVVDVAYRNRVQDLYEQTGEALFYTIDEQNQDFTLPMGDIYGMIENSRHNNYITNCILEAPNGVVTYNGNTITAKQGLKILIPNGRNADGTFNNIEYTLTKDLSFTHSASSSFDSYIVIVKQTSGYIAERLTVSSYLRVKKLADRPTVTPSVIYLVYVEDENKTYLSYEGSEYIEYPIAIIGKYSHTTSSITSLTSFESVELLKYRDKDLISGFGMPSERYIDLTFGASGTSYTAPANGYFYYEKVAGATGKYMTWLNNTTGVGDITVSSTTSTYSRMFPARKGDICTLTYTFTGTTNKFRFHYAEGEK